MVGKTVIANDGDTIVSQALNKKRLTGVVSAEAAFYFSRYCFYNKIIRS